MLKFLTFFSELFEPANPPAFNPNTGAELLPDTLLDVTGHTVGEPDLNQVGPGVIGDFGGLI